MDRTSRTRIAGITLIELLVALSILAVLLGTAVPALQGLRQQLQLYSESHRLLSALRFARSSAVNLRQPVSLCPSALAAAGTAGCSGTYTSGWMVFTNPDRDARFDSGHDRLLRAGAALPAGHRLTDRAGSVESAGLITFVPDGRSHRSLTLRLCAARASTASRSIILSRAGRARLQRDPSPCPGAAP